MKTLDIYPESIKARSIRTVYERALLIIDTIANEGGRALFVGGFVRDMVLSQIHNQQHLTKDIDIEVYGLSSQKLVSVLEGIGTVNKVGASFVVWKIDTIDISLPRRDSKKGTSHRDFDITYDPTMSFIEAARRRDFTINSMMFDPITKELIDEYGGYQDLENKILRAVDYTLFADDSLRVLRAMQLCARFELVIEERTEVLCQEIILKSLSSERIGEEWRKLLTLSRRPSIGLIVARRLHIFTQLHPALDTLFSIEEDFDKFTKTIDSASLIMRENNDVTRDTYQFMLMVIKIFLMNSSSKIAQELDYFFTEIHTSEKMRKNIDCIGKFWQTFISLKNDDVSIRQLSVDIDPLTISDFCLLSEVFMSFCHTENEELKQIQKIRFIRENAMRLGVLHHPLKPIVTGNDVLDCGVSDGMIIGDILKEVFLAQIKGIFSTREDALSYLRQKIK